MSVRKEDNIGPVYSFLGGIALLAAIALYGYQIHLGHEVSDNDKIILLVLIAVCFALLRPKWFDSLVKTVGDWIPFISFRKKDADGNHVSGPK